MRFPVSSSCTTVTGLARATGVSLVALLFLVWLFLYAVLAAFMATELHMNDFGKFYYSTRMFLEGQDMYAPNPATAMAVSDTEVRQLLNMNPPHFHILTLPFAALSPISALVAWTSASLLAFVLSLRLIVTELDLRWTLSRVAWVTAGFIFCSATGAIVVTGQLTFLLLLPVTLAWISARNGLWTRAALYLGLCASLKPFFGVFLVYFLLKRYVAPAAVMVLTGLSCGIAGLAIFGVAAYESWLGALSAVDWTWLPMNGSIAAFVTRAFGWTPSYAPIVDAPFLIDPLTGLLSLVVAASSISCLMRRGASVDQVFACLILAAQLVSPLGWIYYSWLILGPAAAVWLSARSRVCRVRDSLVLVALPGLIVPVTVITFGSTTPWVGLTFGSLYWWTTLFLWGSVIADAMIARDEGRAAMKGASEPWSAPASPRSALLALRRSQPCQ